MKFIQLVLILTIGFTFLSIEDASAVATSCENGESVLNGLPQSKVGQPEDLCLNPCWDKFIDGIAICDRLYPETPTNPEDPNRYENNECKMRASCALWACMTQQALQEGREEDSEYYWHYY